MTRFVGNKSDVILPINDWHYEKASVRAQFLLLFMEGLIGLFKLINQQVALH
ncbi:MAG: hypothetical protein ACRYFZ_14335 [Janthinobacterium lividum]